MPAADTSPLQPALDLQRSLLLRGGWLAAVLLALLISVDGWTLRRAAIAELPDTVRLVARLLDESLAKRSGSFDRETLAIDLGALDLLAPRLPLCLAVNDVRGHVVARRCDALPQGSAAGHWLGQRLREAGDASPHATAPLLLPAGIQAGSVEVFVHWDSLGEAWWQRLRNWLLLAAGLLAIVLAVTRPVGRALRPAQAILAALARLEAGEHGVRLPVPQLRELRDVATRFNRLAERWEGLLAEQQRLAAKLLHAREEERRHLARELHDEMGQSLSALRAESAVIATLAERAEPAPLTAAASRITALGAQLLEGLQQVLADLRPPAIDRFGLVAALQALVAQPRRGRDGRLLDCVLQLPDAGLEQLPAGHAVHIYRIVQEALTNVARHGDASRATVALAFDAAAALVIEVGDDGQGAPAPAPGHGLLGMAERVQALGGSLAIDRGDDGGLRLRVRLPLITEAGA